MNEQSKANEWEFWDYDVSAFSAFHHSSNDKPKTEDSSCKNGPKTSHILPSHIEDDSSRYDEDDDADKAWREFDSYESILNSASISHQNYAEEAQQVMPDDKTKSQAYTMKIQETTKSTSTQGGPKKSLDSCRDKSPSPG
eukprot:CAMPEP_0201696574 /NCGR_PEP_ID=MMETSP0578-20130828/8200_1 /ASSEMBLY_ACC=CAM_ASM_000663 /TAXON_ID=267565 /ORGANISM="Skeletonema grethea, Strain CCMP 1804" /LENGTH=139 /DNA_ID=CAMNT_0048182583 /DNA_START=90 /DNA_END=505 /DNA_ORIENTATION=+